MNDSQPTLTKDALFAYFAHQATPLEQQQIEKWLATPDGMELYFRYLDEWERQHAQFYPDVEKARYRYEQFRHESVQDSTSEITYTDSSASTTGSMSVHLRVNWYRRWLAAVASVVLLVGLWLTIDYWYFTTLTNGYGQLQTIQLPDRSSVVLGANSSLRYARFGFGQSIRRVWLTGEAQFKVTHQMNDKPFIVQTPDRTVVEVLGTTFVVKNRKNTTRVLLETGRVRLTTSRSVRPLMLAPGDLVTVSRTGLLQKQRPPVSNTQVTWHDHRFVFADTPLTEVAHQLNDVFGVTVIIAQPGLRVRTVTGTFQAETADDLLQALTLIMDLRVEQSLQIYKLVQ